MALLSTFLVLLLLSTVSSAAAYGMQKDAQAFNEKEAEKAREFTAQENALNRSFNSAEAEKARQFTERMDSTKYQRSVEDMKSAGLNVGALGSGGGLSSPASSVASLGSSGFSPLASSGISPLGSSVSSVLNEHFDEFRAAFLSNSSKAAKRQVKSFHDFLDSASDGDVPFSALSSLSDEEIDRRFMDIVNRL